MTSSLRGIGDLIAYLPYTLGFVPEHSLVLIAFRDRQIAMTARADRPDGTEVAGLARHLAGSIERVDPDDVLIVAYDGFGAVDRLFVLEVADLLHGRSIDLTHVAVVRPRLGWRAEQCSCGDCPRDWAPVPVARDVDPVAEQVGRGVVPAASRADLHDRLRLRHPGVAAAVETHITRTPLWIQTPRVLPQVLLDARVPVHELAVETLAAATMAVSIVRVRDEVLSWLMPDFLPVDAADEPAPVDPHHLGLPPMWLRAIDSFDDPVVRVAVRMEEWVGCIPPARSVPVLLLVGALRWVSGNGVLASMAVQRALDIDPRCNLALLLANALHHGMRPSDGHQRPA